jgi:hypothetical protein
LQGQPNTMTTFPCLFVSLLCSNHGSLEARQRQGKEGHGAGRPRESVSFGALPRSVTSTHCKVAEAETNQAVPSLLQCPAGTMTTCPCLCGTLVFRPREHKSATKAWTGSQSADIWPWQSASPGALHNAVRSTQVNLLLRTEARRCLQSTVQSAAVAASHSSPSSESETKPNLLRSSCDNWRQLPAHELRGQCNLCRVLPCSSSTPILYWYPFKQAVSMVQCNKSDLVACTRSL